MTGERSSQNIPGDPFFAIESVLIDQRPNSSGSLNNAIAILKLERD
jgi:hypothetical protein